MAKIKHTKNELKQQRESLQRFVRYLPTLQLKKQQLQVEIAKIQRAADLLLEKEKEIENQVLKWVDVFAQDVGIFELLKVKEIVTDHGNIAGIDIPIFNTVEFEETDYDLMSTPLWVDTALKKCKEIIVLKAEQEVYRQQMEILKEELRITNQRVNLFEKVKIPEAKENIRRIRIFLGDLQTAEVVRGKIAKANIERKKELELV